MSNNDFIYALISGLVLILFALSIKSLVRSYTHPSVVYSLVWGGGLLLVAAAGKFGIFPVASYTLLLYIFGAVMFSAGALITSYLMKWKFNSRDVFSELEVINFRSLSFCYILLTLLVMPFIVLSILSHGDDIIEISYNLRVAALNNEPVLPSYLSYYYVLSLSLSLIVLYGVISGKVKLIYFFILFLPFVATMLLVNGRSGLVSLILSWFFAYFFLGGKLSIRIVVLFSVSMFLIIFLGAIFVSKVNIENMTLIDIFFVIFEHVLDYYIQGVVLFDLYFNGKLDISENWDALNTVCQVLSAFDLCQPLPQHQDVALFGEGKLGNVYSIYFSMFPKYGMLGIVFFMSLYGAVAAFFYENAKRGFGFSYVISCFIFSFIILSLFSDGFGYSLILFVQTLFFVYFTLFFFGKKFSFLKVLF